MKNAGNTFASRWATLPAKLLPFADAATKELPLRRLLRLSLFQLSVGMAVALIAGTLNRVMILELSVPAWLVSTMIALPLLFAPARALIGHKSDTYVSLIGWRRVPFIWFGTLMQFGGLSFMPFAILLLGDGGGPLYFGHIVTAAGFLLVGAGLHTTQTAGLALATDLAPDEARPRVVALLYVMLLVGMMLSAAAFSWLLSDFSTMRLIQVLQGAALVTLALNIIALWQQEARQPTKTSADRHRPSFKEAWANFTAQRGAKRILLVVGLGTLAFSLQDILLEPYGGEVLGLSVSATTLLTALFAGGTIIGFATAARRLGNGGSAYRLAALGVMVGIVGFSLVIFADPLNSAALFRLASALVGFGTGLFSVCMLTATMRLATDTSTGMALGAWGAVNATAAGVGLALGGALKDLFETIGESGLFGHVATDPAFGYTSVYHIEIALLFATLVALGPLASRSTIHPETSQKTDTFGLAEFPN
ncbi:MAG: BCD family MFS transporter [Pseudomonadota bacterium]